MKKYILLFLLIAVPAFAAAPTKTYDFTTGTTIRANEVNTNFDDLFGYNQTGIDSVRAGGIDAITELATSIKSGSDQTLVTGTKGSNQEFAVWNSDGDLVSITVMTGNSTGISFSVTPTITTITSCGTLGTTATGQLTCND